MQRDSDVPDHAIHVLPTTSGLAIEVRCSDVSVIDYVGEYFHQWCGPARRSPHWVVTVSTSLPEYLDVQRSKPATAALYPCFAHDQQVMSMPGWTRQDRTIIEDAERSCFLRIGAGRIELLGDPNTRRWRFTLVWTLLEIAATRLRRSHLDLHAAAADCTGRAVLIAGPKGAGKTTLLLHLMQAHRFSLLANDRAMIGRQAGAPQDGFDVIGMPTAIKLRPPTVERFPELRRGTTGVARPYLYTEAELAAVPESDEDARSVDFALTPSQVAGRLVARTSAMGGLALILFPEVCTGDATWRLEALPSNEVAKALLANQYGARHAMRTATLFEHHDGGFCGASADSASKLAGSVAGYRLRLGRESYDDGSLGERLRELAAS